MQSGDLDIIRRVECIAAPVVEEEGFEIWDLVFRSEARQWVLRLTIDRPLQDQTSGVTLDDLTRVHRQLSDVLDAHDLIPRRYTLEVSSPGVDRPLLRPSHYQRYYNQRIRLQTKSAQHDRRVFTGFLREVGESQVSIEDEAVGLVHILWHDIVKANVEYEFPAKGQKKKQTGHR